MKTISLEEPTTFTVPTNTFLIYGDTRTGKTVFGATFPRPLIIGDAVEGGYRSIKNMDSDRFFEPEHKPIINVVENMNDLSSALPNIRALIAAKRVYTVVFDAWTFYADFFLTKIFAANPGGDNRQAYGTLGQHLNRMRVEFHSLGVNVVWACLAKHPDQDDPKGRPLIPGKAADKFAAGVDFLIHSRIEQKKKDGKVIAEEYQLRTRQFGSYIVGNREGVYADNLADPFMGTYADFMTAIGYDVDAIRAAMPKPGTVIAPTKPTAPPAASAKPPAAPVKKRPAPRPAVK